MQKWRGALLLLAVVLLPLVINIDAYRGYFEDDDFDSLSWAQYIPLKSYVLDLPCLAYPCQHNRPTGFFYYSALFQTAELRYAAWVLTLQIIACVNVLLLWLLLRKIGMSEISAMAGCIFFVTSRALFDVWWKPSYIYDVLCTSFALASLLAYSHRRWVLSFIAFWLAMRSKEIGMAVPAMLLCYEMTLGERRWKRVLLYLLPAAIYGAYGLRFNLKAATGTEYGLGHTPAAVWNTVLFYSTKLFWIPYAGFLLLAAPLVVRDRRLDFGISAMACGIAIYVLLPGRLVEVYLYLAMIGAAVAIAVLAARWPLAIAVLAVAWVPWQTVLVRNHAHVTLAAAKERRAYVAALRTIPDAPSYAYAGAPTSFQRWGVEGALHLFHGHDLPIFTLADAALPPDQRMLLVSWDPKARRMDTEAFAPRDYAFLSADANAASWQLSGGWTEEAHGYRDILGNASVRMFRPAEATEFIWESCGGPGDHLHAFLDGAPLPALMFDQPGCQNTRVPVGGGSPKMVSIDFIVSPVGRTMRIGSLGFVTAPGAP
jgi:hypothetical protein